MEPERTIEKLLRAYAKKRRERADASLKMHPATRRRLQDEIARSAPDPDDESESLSLWELIRQQWAFLLSFAVCIFLLAMMLWPVINSFKKKAYLVEMTNSMPPETVTLNYHLAAPKSDEITRTLSPIAETNLVAQNSALAPAPAAANGNYELPAPASALAELPEASSSSESAAGALPATMTPPSALPAPASEYANNSFSPPPGTQSQEAKSPVEQQQVTTLEDNSLPSVKEPAPSAFAERAQQLNAGLPNSYRNSITPVLKFPVLANFQVQQKGTAIRIVDQDGSVYEGSLLVANPNAQNLDGFAPNNIQEDKVTSRGETGGGGGGGGFGGASSIQNSAVNGTLQGAVQNYFLRVSGTNRTLNQNVVFTGNLLANIVATKVVQQKLGVNAGVIYGAGVVAGQVENSLTNQSDQLPWSSLRIAGTAVVNSTNHIEVNAAPEPPPKN
jgi:hypothetical protein